MLTGPAIDIALSDLLDALPDGVAWSRPVHDKAGQLLDFQVAYVNAGLARITTPPYSVQPGMLWREMLASHPQVEPDNFDEMLRVFATGTPYEYTFRDEAQQLWYTIRRSRVSGGILSVVRDVSLLQKSRRGADQQNDLLQTMLDGAINGVLLLEPVYEQGQPVDFQILAANQATAVLTKIDSVAAVGRLMGTIYPAFKTSGFFSLYCQVLADGQPRRQEYWYDDGRLASWFEASVVKQGQRLVASFNDTTSTKNAVENAHQVAERLQAVIDHSQTGIFVFSPVLDERGQLVDFRFKTINRMVAAMVGEAPDKLTGAVASDWFISYRETGLFDRYRQTYLTGESQRFDINYNVDGFDVWFDVQSVRVNDDVLVTFTDYTLLKQAQQAIEEQADQTWQQTQLLNSVLDSSESGIIAFEAIRDPPSSRPSSISGLWWPIKPAKPYCICP